MRAGREVTRQRGTPRLEASFGPLMADLAPFFGILGLVATLLPLFDDWDVYGGLYLAGLATLAVALVAGVTVPWQRLPHLAQYAVPLLAFVSTALLSAAGLRVAVLACLPAIALARSLGTVGVVLGTLAATVCAWSDQLTHPTGVTSDSFARLVLLPVVTGIVASWFARVERRSRARASLISRQGQELSASLEELTRGRAIVDAVLRSLAIGVLVTDSDGRALVVNPALRELLGEPLSEGASPADLAEHPNPRAGRTRVREYSARAARREVVTDDTQWWELPDGELRALRTSVVPFTSRRGGGHYQVMAVEDLTSEMLARKAQQDFVDGVSHELRTPLTSILGFLELAIDDLEETSASRRSLEVAERNAHRLLELIDDLLTLAAMGQGTAELGSAVVDVSEIAAEAVISAEPAADAAGITIDARLDRGLHVQGDRRRLGQVLDNLLSNAVKYSDRGGLVRLVVQGRGGDVVIEVIDQGIGISPEDQERLFEQFFRAPQVRDSDRRGTGLGLSITREIVERHGGSVSVRSAAGSGSTFEVVLPRAEAPTAPGALP